MMPSFLVYFLFRSAIPRYTGAFINSGAASSKFQVSPIGSEAFAPNVHAPDSIRSAKCPTDRGTDLLTAPEKVKWT